jgi:hypothetical protein
MATVNTQTMINPAHSRGCHLEPTGAVAVAGHLVAFAQGKHQHLVSRS